MESDDNEKAGESQFSSENNEQEVARKNNKQQQKHKHKSKSSNSVSLGGAKSSERMFHTPAKMTLTEVVSNATNSWRIQQQELENRLKRKREEEEKLMEIVKRSKQLEGRAFEDKSLSQNSPTFFGPTQLAIYSTKLKHGSIRKNPPPFNLPLPNQTTTTDIS